MGVVHRMERANTQHWAWCALSAAALTWATLSFVARAQTARTVAAVAWDVCATLALLLFAGAQWTIAVAKWRQRRRGMSEYSSSSRSLIRGAVAVSLIAVTLVASELARDHVDRWVGAAIALLGVLGALRVVHAAPSARRRRRL